MSALKTFVVDVGGGKLLDLRTAPMSDVGMRGGEKRWCVYVAMLVYEYVEVVYTSALEVSRSDLAREISD